MYRFHLNVSLASNLILSYLCSILLLYYIIFHSIFHSILLSYIILESLQAVNLMIDLQQSIYRVHRKVFEQKEVNEFLASALIPLVVESYNLYTLETYFIRKLVEGIHSIHLYISINEYDFV